MGNSLLYGKMYKRDQLGDLYETKPLFIFSSDNLARDPESPLPVCCNDTQSEFRAYKRNTKEGERAVGMYCKHCHAEWLDASIYRNGKFQENDKVEIRVVDSENMTVTFENSSVCNISTSQQSVLTRKVPRDGMVKDFFDFLMMTIPHRRMIERYSPAMNNLKPGNHIMWHRPYAVWHHQLIRRKTGQYKYDVIHFDTSNDQRFGFNVKVQEKENLDFSKERGTLYKVIYNSSIERENPKELVFDRANAKLHDTNYRLFTYNCEHVISFCKTGRLRSFQASWLKTELVFFVMRAIAILVACIVGSYIDHCFNNGDQSDDHAINTTTTSPSVHKGKCQKSEIVEVVLIFTLELIMFFFIVWRHWKVFKNKGIERLDFFRRVGEALIEVVFTLGLYYLHILIVFIVSRHLENGMGLTLDIILGITLGILGKMIGFFLGQFVCQKVVKSRKKDPEELEASIPSSDGSFHHEFSSSRGYGSCSSTSDVSWA